MLRVLGSLLEDAEANGRSGVAPCGYCDHSERLSVSGYSPRQSSVRTKHVAAGTCSVRSSKQSNGRIPDKASAASLAELFRAVAPAKNDIVDSAFFVIETPSLLNRLNNDT